MDPEKSLLLLSDVGITAFGIAGGTFDAKDHCFHSACQIVVRFGQNEAASCTTTP
jgi:hypothetical protein